jgi:hypothetical protein
MNFLRRYISAAFPADEDAVRPEVPSMRKGSLIGLAAAAVILSLIAVVQSSIDVDRDTTPVDEVRDETQRASEAALKDVAAPKPQTIVSKSHPAQTTSTTQRASARHILVSFKDSELGLVERTRADAAKLASILCDRMKSGEDTTKLIESFSDDPNRETDGGIRRVTDFGVEPKTGETPRARMPEAYADVLFGLAPGACAVVDYDPKRCTLGYFVIQRID